MTRKDPRNIGRKLRFHAAHGARPRPRHEPGSDETVEIFTDGACKGNPGPGGWGVILRMERQATGALGRRAETTNNRMEMTAAIAA